MNVPKIHFFIDCIDLFPTLSNVLNVLGSRFITYGNLIRKEQKNYRNDRYPNIEQQWYFGSVDMAFEKLKATSITKKILLNVFE